MLDDCIGLRVQGTTPPIYACAVGSMNFSAETKFEKGASDRNSPPGSYTGGRERGLPSVLHSRGVCGDPPAGNFRCCEAILVHHSEACREGTQNFWRGGSPS